MKITSKSQLKKNKKFSLNLFKTPFCYKEKKKFRYYEMPPFKSQYFKNKKILNELSQKCLFISGPARNGNHLLLSLLDNHPEIESEIGEDDMIRTVFSHAIVNEKKVIQKIKSGNLNYILNLSGQPPYGKGKGVNKWKKLYLMYKKNIKSKVWSGNQPEGKPHITDFQNIVPKIDYLKFLDTLKKSKKNLSETKSFLDFFDIYLGAKLKLATNKSKKKKKIKFRWTGSGLRRELFYLLERSNKIICLTPIRKFENFYYSYAKTRHSTTEINQTALNDLWEHWRHKVIDYLILKKKYPNKIYLIQFEDLINNPKRVMKKICKILNINFSHSLLKPTLLGKSHLGNSSFKKEKNQIGKIYKSVANRKLPNVELPNEYAEIIKLIKKNSI